MNNKILFEFSPWFIFLCLVTGFIYAYTLYKQKNPWSNSFNFFLGIIRFLSVSILSFLLLGPLLKQIQNIVIPPSFVIAVDNSQSVSAIYDQSEIDGLNAQLSNIQSSLLKNKYKVEVKEISGNSVEDVTQISYDYPISNIHNLLKDIENEYEGKNLAGTILLSDGIYNQGISPNYFSYTFPILTLGVGDTIEKQDLILKSVNYNKISYQGNQFILQAEIYNKGFKGENISVSVLQAGQILKSKIINVDAEKGLQTLDFQLTAENPGIQRYKLLITPVSNEFSEENNSQDAYIEVIEGKEKILLLAHSPHPDLKAFKNSIEKNDNYELFIVLPGISEVPNEKFDLAILHQLPDQRGTFNNEIEKLKNLNTPLLYVIGNKTRIDLFNNQNQHLKINARRNQKDNVFASLNIDFSQFTINPEIKELASDMPPVTVPFGEYLVKGESESIFYQQVGNIKTQKPLVLISKNASQKQAIFAGEGFWRWRLHEYRLTNNFNGFDDLINKIVQYLSAKEDKRKFRVYPVNSEIWDNEPVIFETEIYNSVYEKVYDQRIDLSITDEDNKESKYSYIITQANSRFRINGLLPGVYNYVANAVQEGQPLTNKGMFSIKPLQLENTNLKADHDLLRALSNRSDGSYYNTGEYDMLISDIVSAKPKSMIFSSENYFAIINLKWVFFLLIFLFSMEWGLRKYLGGY